ncbi:MAG: hypothetical protein JW969_05365 [Spirochaetales bacterium]|nr:hypothetical protein [Spirochaetales bacterium]
MVIPSINLANINEHRAPLRPNSIRVWEHQDNVWENAAKLKTENPAGLGTKIDILA